MTTNKTIETSTPFDRKGYIVIQKNPQFIDYATEEEYEIMNENQFEIVALSDTYGNYGQKIERGDAGDYIQLLTQEAVDFANTHNEEGNNINEFSIDDIISAYDDCQLVCDIIEYLNSESYALTQEMVLAHTYWDGHNWKTITIEVETNEPSHVRVNSEKEKEILSEYFRFDDYNKDGAGLERANGEAYFFVRSNWQGSYELATVRLYNPEQE